LNTIFSGPYYFHNFLILNFSHILFLKIILCQLFWRIKTDFLQVNFKYRHRGQLSVLRFWVVWRKRYLSAHSWGRKLFHEVSTRPNCQNAKLWVPTFGSRLVCLQEVEIIFDWNYMFVWNAKGCKGLWAYWKTWKALYKSKVL